MRSLFLFFSIPFLTFPVLAANMWVATEKASRHTCPSETCGDVGFYMFRELADVFEIKDGWARVSQFYDASCVNGVSEYVDSGPASCTSSNGIDNGMFSEWIKLNQLTDIRPEDPALNATGDYLLIKGSSDYAKYKDVFSKSARELISDGRCTEGDFIEMGGWSKTPDTNPTYFTYCGGMDKAHKVQLNAESGEIFN